MLPRDPVMLLSYVNTQLREREIGYEYDAAQNRFV